jgi:hypothetical protein
VKPTTTIILWCVFISTVEMADAQNGLVARYLLNGDAMDLVGTNHGTVVQATPTNDHFGRNLSAYQFNGANARIEFAAPPPIDASAWTIAAWVKPDTFNQAGLAVYIGRDNGAVSDGAGFGVAGAATLYGFTPTAGGFFSSGASFPAVGEWAHVAMTRSGGVIAFYLNGARTPNTSSVAVANPTDMTIGSQNGLRYFFGAVDDLRIYNRALSSNEIIVIYENNDGPCSPHAAKAVPTVFNGFVVDAEITDGGCGYTNAPNVRFVGGSGSNAVATASISNGIVAKINVMDAGCCYSAPPKIVIDSPPFLAAVSIRVSRLIVGQHVMIGRRYVLEGSSDLINWTDVGVPFTADTEEVETEVVAGVHQFFRTREIVQ